MLNKEKLNFKNINYFLTALMVATPLLIVLIVAICGYLRTGIFPEPGLKWNDEAAYLQMIKNCITTGSPVGYWGFNGNHALVGTGGAWSPAIIWPYAIFAFVFPLTQGFVFYVNLFYITLANLIFVLCVKPDTRQNISLILAQATSAVFILYLSVNMSEIFRYALAIVIAGFLYKMLFGNCKAWLKYFLIPLVIVASVQVYVFFAFCIPVYVFALLKEKRFLIKGIVSLGAMGIVTMVSYYLLHLISSNYNIYKTENLLNAVKALDIFGALIAFLKMMKQGMVQVFLLWQYVYANPLIPWHVLFSAFLVVISLVMMGTMFWQQRRKRELHAKEQADASSKKAEKYRHDGILGTIVVYSLPLFYLMYMTLYSIEPFTFVRGTQIVVVFSVWLLALMKKRIAFILVILVQAVSLVFLPANLEYFMEERYASEEVKEEWDSLESEFRAVFEVDETLGPWANTVAMYTMEPKVICALPGGLGVNFIMEDGIFAKEAGYILCSKVSPGERNSEWLEKSYEEIEAQFGEILVKEYKVIFESDSYIVFKQKNR